MNSECIERVVCQGIEYAVIIRANYHADGIQFFTPAAYSQQLGYMNRPEGYRIQPHVHNSLPREVLYTQEVILVKSGKVRVDFFDESQRLSCSHVLSGGDVILLANGGHGFEMLEPTELIEIKQGPHVGEQDKTRFNALT